MGQKLKKKPAKARQAEKAMARRLKTIESKVEKLKAEAPMAVTTYGSKGRMSDQEAFEVAQRLFGRGAVIGRNNQYVDKPLHVGKKAKFDVWAQRGVGNSWEECFAAVKEYPDFPGGVPKHLT